MGNAATRQILADAASAVEGLTGHPYYVANFGAGDVLIDVAEIVHPNPFGGLVTWSVTLICPPDLHDAQKYADAKAPQLRDALAPHLTVQRVQPQQTVFDSGTVPTVVITGTREED